MTLYNIYFGTIGKTLGVRYRFTKLFKNEEEALEYANKSATSLYYKNEGKFGIPAFSKVLEESKITGIDIKQLYEDHIKDLCRYYVIPTEVDTIPNRKLKY